jgi:hypothetical protein
MINRKCIAIACAFWACAFQLHAETIEIGRATIEFPEGNWQALTVNEGKTVLDAGVRQSLATDERAFMLVTGDQIQAILNISSSKSGAAVVTNWSNTCKSTERIYAVSLTSDPNALACERATGPLKTDLYLKAAMPQAAKQIEERGLKLPNITQSTSGTVGNDRGTMLHINLLTVSSFSGVQGDEISGLPSAVKPVHAMWAHRLVLAIKESVYSMSGKMTVPPVSFNTAHASQSTTP